jgi:hypothetical protein
MLWKTEWNAISGRIRGLEPVAKIYLTAQLKNSSDPYGIGRRQLLPHSIDIFETLEKFLSSQQSNLSEAASKCLTAFVATYKDKKIFDRTTDTPMDKDRAIPCITALLGFAVEFDYILADFSTTARKLSERAFAHLQRTITADSVVRTRWIDAFENGEMDCEKLGAVHLLQHGIWAFKVSGEGERTDLVYTDSLVNLDDVTRSAEALVLTEWKRVQKTSDLEKHIKQAIKQAARYAAGVLYGLELAEYRYLVMVSKEHMMNSKDVRDGDIIYRIINIAVNPSTPSAPVRQ